mgnify:CR=1 FL=1
MGGDKKDKKKDKIEEKGDKLSASLFSQNVNKIRESKQKIEDSVLLMQEFINISQRLSSDPVTSSHLNSLIKEVGKY